MGQRVRSSTSNDAIDVRGMEESLQRTQSELADVRNRLSQLNQDFKRKTDEYSRLDTNLKNIEKTELKVGCVVFTCLRHRMSFFVFRHSNRELHP